MLSTIRSSNSTRPSYSRGDRAAALEEQAVGELHDVGLVDGRDRAAAVRDRVVEGVARDPLRGLAGDDLDALRRIAADPVLDARRRGLPCSRGRSRGRRSGSGVSRPFIDRAGRTFAYRPSAWRSVTLTDRKPSPIGVVIGPFRATRLRRIESRTCSGSGVPYSAMTASPASTTSQSNATPEASRTRRVASASSGPMPSPGISVTRWVMARMIAADADVRRALDRRPADWRGPCARVRLTGSCRRPVRRARSARASPPPPLYDRARSGVPSPARTRPRRAVGPRRIRPRAQFEELSRVKIQEADAKSLLLAQGLPVPPWEVARTAAEARAAAERLLAAGAGQVVDQGAGARRRPRQGGRREARRDRPTRPRRSPAAILGMDIKGITGPQGPGRARPRTSSRSTTCRPCSTGAAGGSS